MAATSLCTPLLTHGMQRIKDVIEAVIVNCRWVVAPFLLGLIVGLAAPIYKFVLKLL